jgi:D-alanyl-D-alanine carboxypeptidase (penicillin-binding protein 5/6)
MKTIILLSCLQLIAAFLSATLSVDVEAEAAILMNADTGAILFAKNIHDLHYPASTTKVATALYALHLKKDALETTRIVATPEPLVYVSTDQKAQSNYTLPNYWLEPKASHIRIRRDEEFSLSDLLKGMLIASGSDAANLIAHALGDGSILKFTEGLNVFIRQLGCHNTTFYNPHGLHHPQHQTTAYDLALITREALKDPTFRSIVAQKIFVRPKTPRCKSLTFWTTNRLLRSGPFYYDKAIGVKTGTGGLARSNFIGAATHEGRTLIAVLLKAENRPLMLNSTIALFEAAFKEKKIQHVFLKEGQQAFSRQLPHANAPLQTYLKEDLSLDYYPSEDPQAKYLLYWDNLALPIHKNQKVGELHLVSQEGKILMQQALLAQSNVTLKSPYNWTKVLFTYPFILSSALLATIVVLTILFFRQRKIFY